MNTNKKNLLARLIQYSVFSIHDSGFTLIELLIAISISTLLVSGGAISYRDFNQRQTIKSTALTMKSVLRDIQSKAISGEKPVDTPCTQLIGYEVQVTQNQVQTVVQCTNGNSPAKTAYTMPSQVTISSSTPAFVFKALGQGIDQPATIDIVGFNKQYELAVTTTGEIQDKDFVPLTIPTAAPAAQVTTVTPSPSASLTTAQIQEQLNALVDQGPSASGGTQAWIASIWSLIQQLFNSRR